MPATTVGPSALPELRMVSTELHRFGEPFANLASLTFLS